MNVGTLSLYFSSTHRFFLLWLWSWEQSNWKQEPIFQLIHIIASMKFKQNTSQLRILFLNLPSEDLSLSLIEYLHILHHMTQLSYNSIHVLKSSILLHFLLAFLSFLFFLYYSPNTHLLISHAQLPRISSRVQSEINLQLHSRRGCRRLPNTPLSHL